MSLEELTQIANVKSWTSGVEVEWAAAQQLRNLAALPILAGHIAVMPDVHMGKGATVGSVIATRAAIIPAAVGVDIGCGMAAVRTGMQADDLPHSLQGLRSRIEAAVPVGFDMHAQRVDPIRDGRRGLALSNAGRTLAERFARLQMLEVLGDVDEARMHRQLGTLGGGNHFIEVCLDEKDAVWVMLHSGSRHIGKTIGEAAIHMAREVAERVERRLADRDLAWLDEGSVEFERYVEALRWAQDYAAHNRALMLHAVAKAVHVELGREMAPTESAVSCHHNYASLEQHFGQQVWVTRKGAVSARRGELGIIPGSMGAKSYIVRGKGQAESYCSCSHGAGRRLSRGAAKKAFKVEDLLRQTEGVECRKDAGVLDEIPGAYKDIDAVMAAQTDLVEIVHTLKQVMCIKG
jgi:tRNA-splicing ligase RtcB